MDVSPAKRSYFTCANVWWKLLFHSTPTAQGIISVLSFAVNVFVFAYILKRAKVQKKNPWKNEIFTDTKDYKEAMERA